MNGINNIYQNTLMGNTTVSFNQSERTKKNGMPKGTISGGAELKEEQKSGLSIQMNTDKDTFEFSGKINTNADPNATTSRVDRYIADMGKEEQEQLAEEYLRKAQEIEEQFKNGEITQDERQGMQEDLRKMYKVDHTVEAFTLDGEEYCTMVLFKDEKRRNSKDPNLCNAKIAVDLTGKREQIYGNFENAESIIRPKPNDNNAPSKEQSTPIEEAITGEGKQKLSAQLVKNLMKDYMYQNDKTMMEKQKERMDEKQEEEESQLQFFEAFAKKYLIGYHICIIIL